MTQRNQQQVQEVFQVETGFNMPVGRAKYGKYKKAINTINNMYIGTSFFFPTRSTSVSHLYQLAKENGKQITVLKQEGGFRIWRKA